MKSCRREGSTPLLTKPTSAPHHPPLVKCGLLPRNADAALHSDSHQAPLVLSVNGATVETLLPRTTPLLSFLRNDCSLNGPKYGCGLGECGTCSVLIDRQLARACVLTLGDAAGRAVTTLEGLAANGRLDPVQEAFIACAAAQCGYCLNGMIMTARALIDVNPRADGGGDPRGAAVQPVPVRRACRDRRGGAARGDARSGMIPLQPQGLRRADYLEPFGTLAVVRPAAPDAPLDAAPADDLEPFILVRASGEVTAFNGHVDLGTGVRTALGADRRGGARRRIRTRRDGARRQRGRARSGADHRQRDHPAQRQAPADSGGAGAPLAHRQGGRGARRPGGRSRRRGRRRADAGRRQSPRDLWRVDRRRADPPCACGRRAGQARLGAPHRGRVAAAGRSSGQGHRRARLSFTTCACPACCTGASFGRLMRGSIRAITSGAR